MTEWNHGIAKLTLPTPFPVGDVNVYLLNEEKLTLVDVGPNTEEAFTALCEQLSLLGVQLTDIEQVVLTHHHPDHAGLLERFRDDLPVYGHALNERWIHRSEAFMQEQEEFFIELFREFGIPQKYFPLIGAMRKTLKYACQRSLTGTLQEGDSPVGLPSFQVIETPGHAQSHIGLYRAKDGVFLAGDHLLARISPNPLLEPPVQRGTGRPMPLLQYLASLKKLLKLPITVAYTGHGKEVQDAQGLIHKQMAKQRERAWYVLSLLANGPLTVFEVCQILFPTVYERELSLTISETVGQLDYLVAEELVNVSKRNGVLLFSHANS